MRHLVWARDLANSLLERPLRRRCEHSRGVGARGEMLAPILGKDAELLAMSAWLHDIGYAPDLVDTGFHPIDGARYLRDVHGADEDLCTLVAHHSCAEIEAADRGLLHILDTEFPMRRPDLAEALTFCDMTTSPDGLAVNVTDRLTEIRARYGEEHDVSAFIRKAGPRLVAQVHAVENRLVSAEMRLGCPA